MTTQTLDQTLPVGRGRLAVVLVPLALALLGAALRYVAYLSLNPAGSPQGFAQAMCVWDCSWYGDIAEHGYQLHPEVLNFGGPAGIANWAFFPLFPLLIGGIERLVAVPLPLLGAIVSPLLTLAAALLSRPLFEGDRRAYYLFSAFLLCGPFSFYLSTLYSESLFLLLTVIAFVQLQRRNYIAAGLAGAFLSATRGIGVFFVFSVLAEALAELGRRPLADALKRPDVVLGIVLVPLGLFAFMGWLHYVTGDALAFLHIQRGWDREPVGPLAALWGALTADEGQVRDSLALGISALVGLALCGVLAWRRELPQAIFCTLSLVFALGNGVESVLRFVVTLAPLCVVLSQLLGRWRWLFWLSLLAFAGLGVEGTRLWLQQRGALM